MLTAKSARARNSRSKVPEEKGARIGFAESGSGRVGPEEDQEEEKAARARISLLVAAAQQTTMWVVVPQTPAAAAAGRSANGRASDLFL